MNTAASAAKKVIFNAAAVAARLGALKAAAVADGKEDTAWWTPALKIEWVQPRKGNNGTQWASVSYTDENGVSGRLVVRINGERHTGQIMPSTDAGVAELAAKVKNPNVKVEKRTKKPSIQIQKWAAQVKTAEDGITILADADGQPILPDDDKLSPYFQVAALVGEAFAAEAKERVDRGLALVAKAAEMKRADKTVTAQAVLEAFNAAQGGRRPGDMIISSENVSAIRKIFPNQKDSDALTKGATVTSNVKITALVQEYISDQAKKNAGLPLPNPMTRIAMNFDATTGLAQLSFFDKSQPFMEANKPKYETGKVDGDPINADNVHKFVLSRSGLDGIVNMDSVCLSNMGISMPVKAEVLVVDKPSGGAVSIDDVYEDDDVYGGGYGQPAADSEPAAPADIAPAAPPAAPAKPAAAPAKPASKPAAEEENYDDLLGELAATTVTGQNKK